MITILQAEYRKIIATKTWWLLLLALVATTAVMAVLSAWMGFIQSQASGSPPQPDKLLRLTTVASASLCYVFPLALGAVMVTSEYRHHTINLSMLGEPRRARFVIGKLIIAVPFGALFGIAGTLAGTVTGAVTLRWKGLAVPLFDRAVIHTMLLSVLLVGIWVLLGVCLGLLVPNQSIAIAGIITFTQLIEPVIRLACQSWETGRNMTRFLPGAAGEAALGDSFLNASNSGHLLEPWQGLVVLAGYGLVMLVAGTMRLITTDIE